MSGSTRIGRPPCHTSPLRGRARISGLIGLAGATLVGGLAVLNRALRLDDLPPTLPGAMLDWRWRGWRVRYTMMGEGPPLVLLHGVHAAASSFEMRNIFEPLSQRFTVYAIDLLGFGKSDRPNVAYSAAMYSDLLREFLEQVAVIGGQSAVVVASSLSTAYAVSVARARPDLVARLVLLSPSDVTGLGAVGRAFGRLLALPLLGTALFNALVSRQSIERFLVRAYADPWRVDQTVVGQQWATAHQPNARLAPAAFVGGRLDRPFWEIAAPVAMPVLVIRGDRPGIGPQTPDAALHGLSRSVTIETISGAGQLPHDEAWDQVVALIEPWVAAPR
jgi:pimeloyl-ACP methyl ester carboxylesterase